MEEIARLIVCCILYVSVVHVSLSRCSFHRLSSWKREHSVRPLIITLPGQVIQMGTNMIGVNLWTVKYPRIYATVHRLHFTKVDAKSYRSLW